ncbi:S9 family peptidase [Leptobacterium sp. I13]|uniref:S9 family peptidase n=1 Tax=Leptobacterium meishanense TaxID=3128904 RepID=UPI0030EB45D5
MKKNIVVFFLSLSFSTSLIAQNQQITLEEIWGGAFRTESMDVLRSLNNGKQYAVLNVDRRTKATTVDVYDYETLEKVKTLVSSNNLDALDNFSSYEFSNDESKLLLATDITSIYRRSTLGRYYVYDIKAKTLSSVSENKIQEPTFSPDAGKVAFVYENNIYVKDLTSGETKQITTDGKKNKIINGVTDWVYEEEFSFVRAFDWNETGTHIAYIRFDEREVPEFSMDVYGEALYPTQQVFKYPKAGEENSEVNLFVYDLTTGKAEEVSLKDAYYIPRMKWTNDPEVLSIQVMNRHQNKLDIMSYDVNSKTTKTILSEQDDAYIDVTDNLKFLNDNSFLWTSEQNGYNHIYLYDRNGKLIRQITSGEWEVTNFYGFSPNTARIYYQSTEEGSINRAVYSIGINGKGKKLLTPQTGNNSAKFSSDYTYFINTHSSAYSPYRYTLHRSKDGKELKEIVNNNKLEEKLIAYNLPKKEFTTINVHGNELNMWMMKPVDFDPEKSYPLFMFQYSGPGSQQVSNRWHGSNDYWHMLLAQQGYIVVCVDGRGTGYKGANFKKLTYKELGKYEVEDQIEAAKVLGEQSFIDENRVGIWGWSYGGFMSSNAILKGNDVFKMAIAVAPVTSWRFYDTIYTERYMQTPQENPSGYDDNSPISHVDKLKGSYLLIHGSADDNVHVQNTMRMIEALVQANKQFEWAIYPDKNHGIFGGYTRLQLYTKMTNFIKENL